MTARPGTDHDLAVLANMRSMCRMLHEAIESSASTREPITLDAGQRHQLMRALAEMQLLFTDVEKEAMRAYRGEGNDL